MPSPTGLAHGGFPKGDVAQKATASISPPRKNRWRVLLCLLKFLVVTLSNLYLELYQLLQYQDHHHFAHQETIIQSVIYMA